MEDLFLLIRIGLGVTAIGCLLMTSWMRIVRRAWPSGSAFLSTAMGFLGITILSVLAYLILEH